MTHKAIAYAAAHKWEGLAKVRGVSKVARSGRGFMRAYQRAGSFANLPEEWKRKREAFIARHMAQVKNRGEQLWKNGRPSRRALALIMWAYMPPGRNPLPFIPPEEWADNPVKPGATFFIERAARNEYLKAIRDDFYRKTGRWLTLAQVEDAVVATRRQQIRRVK